MAPDLSGVSDPIPYIQMLAYRVQMCALAANGTRVRERTVEVYLRDVEKIFAGIGAKDPCLYILGNINFHLSFQIHAYVWE